MVPPYGLRYMWNYWSHVERSSCVVVVNPRCRALLIRSLLRPDGSTLGRVISLHQAMRQSTPRAGCTRLREISFASIVLRGACTATPCPWREPHKPAAPMCSLGQLPRPGDDLARLIFEACKLVHRATVQVSRSVRPHCTTSTHSF